jgi:hypothetical protein
MKFNISDFSKICRDNSSFIKTWQKTGGGGVLYIDLSTFMISRRILLRMRNVSDEIVDKIKTHVLCSVSCFRKSCRLWDNVEKYGKSGQSTDDNIIRRMRLACRITKATDTHSEYVILFLSYDSNGYTSSPRSYVIITLSVYQEIPTRCHGPVRFFLSSWPSQDDGRPHDTVTVPDVAYAVNFIDLLMMDTERVRNM